MGHYIIYSHGFGVDKTDRGLLTDIARALPDAKHILFDYNEIDAQANTLTVNRFQEQVGRLKAQLARLDDGEEKVIDLVAHSQGCIIAALAKPQHIRNVIFITPPENLNMDRMLDIFGSREGSRIDLEGESRIPRRDGTTTIIPKEYWASINNVNVLRQYNYLSDLAKKVTFFMANDDEILGATTFDYTDDRIELIQLDGNHDFTDAARPVIVRAIKQLLSVAKS